MAATTNSILIRLFALNPNELSPRAQEFVRQLPAAAEAEREQIGQQIQYTTTALQNVQAHFDASQDQVFQLSRELEASRRQVDVLEEAVAEQDEVVTALEEAVDEVRARLGEVVEEKEGLRWEALGVLDRKEVEIRELREGLGAVGGGLEERVGKVEGSGV
ncbi:hypothetical protein B0A50_05457 [Salinomyces thailandicus]|uniref:Uncharacterized protein n=1 Tax=Salinomyces thailandicus TaxID=706561 RepID=A0A4U0TUE8_9PEZI|nr:hypothetical protein B0A50_05457 [Salinomyces thailandica]